MSRKTIASYSYPAKPSPINGTAHNCPISLQPVYDLAPVQGNTNGAPDKERFLLDACALLEGIANGLASYEFLEKEIWVIPGGKAVAGDASARYWQRDRKRGLHVSVIAGMSEPTSMRADGLAIYARTLTEDDMVGLRSHTYWLSADASDQLISRTLAAVFQGTIHPILTSEDIQHPNPDRAIIVQVC